MYDLIMATDITPEQCRAARAFLGWHQQDLADRSRTTTLTVHLFETRKRRTSAEVRANIRAAFERAGVTFEERAITHPPTRPAGR